MDILEFFTIQNTIALTGALTGVSGFIFGYRERKINNRSKKVDILDWVMRIGVLILCVFIIPAQMRMQERGEKNSDQLTKIAI